MSANLKKHLLYALTATLALSLASCSAPPSKPIKESTKPVNVNPIEKKPKKLGLLDYQKLRSDAADMANWPGYIAHSNQVWKLSPPDQRPLIEDQVWTILNTLTEANREQISATEDATVQSWFYLYELFNNIHIDQQQAITDLKSYYSDAIFHNHLFNQLLDTHKKAEDLKQIAVLLPMQGKYKVVSQQIRNGMVKALYHSDSTLTIRFYDSSDFDELENIYSQAKQDGAERIIGPLRKEAAQSLASFHDETMLLLNSIENSNVSQFSFKSSRPEEQMRQRFKDMGLTRIGILTSDKNKNILKAQALKATWEQAPQNSAHISIYPDKKPKLRKALGEIIHENYSKERLVKVSSTVAAKLDFFPRTRKDLDGIVIFDDQSRVSVFRPQMDYFSLDLPVFSDSQVSPKNLQDIQNNKDLKGVEFLSYPAVLEPEDLNSKFEAFGWDSFIVTTHFNPLRAGACLNNGKTGILSMKGPKVKQHQIWLTFNRQGKLMKAPNIIVNPEPEPIDAEAAKVLAQLISQEPDISTPEHQSIKPLFAPTPANQNMQP